MLPPSEALKMEAGWSSESLVSHITTRRSNLDDSTVNNGEVLLQMVFQLDPWSKVLVMAIGAAVVMIALIIVVCFVGPGCYGYEWLHRGKFLTSEQTLLCRGSAAPVMGPVLLIWSC
jgi:hypothetical protein